MPKPFSIKERLKSFVFAFAGIGRTFKEEHNFRIQVFAAILIVLAACYFPITKSEWMWIIVCISAVLTAELFNTAIEALADEDEADPNQNPVIGKIKDASAGAVLVISLAALIIGLLIFWPHICLICSKSTT